MSNKIHGAPQCPDIETKLKIMDLAIAASPCGSAIDDIFEVYDRIFERILSINAKPLEHLDCQNTKPSGQMARA